MKPLCETILQGEVAEEAKALVSKVGNSLTQAAKHLTARHPEWHGGAPAYIARSFWAALAPPAGGPSTGFKQ